MIPKIFFPARKGSQRDFSSIKKLIIESILFSCLLIILLSFFSTIASAQILPLPPVENYNGSVQDPGTGGTAEQRFASLVVGVIMNIRYLLTAISIAMIVYGGFRMVIAQGNGEVFEKQKGLVTWAIIGLALVGFAGDLTRILGVGACDQLKALPGYNNVGCTPGGFLKDPNAIIRQTTLFNQRTQFIMSFIKYLIGGIAALMLMRNALRLVTNQSGDEIEKDKKNIMWSIIGLFLIIISDTVINRVFFKLDTSRYASGGNVEPAIDYGQGIKEIVGFTNFVVSIVSPLAIIGIVAAGIMYVTSAGNEETQNKAKRLITLSLVGLLIMYGAFAIVSTFISGRFDTAAT